MHGQKKILLYTLLTAIIFAVAFPLLNYTGKEGFNPSDDGVILAQSWRIIQGEVPHKDFISLRPVLSGLLHTIHFYSPLPLEDSARWFVVFQNFLISFLWVYLMLAAFRINSAYLTGVRGFLSLAIIAFTMNLNHHGLFPWTTVDALFWSVIGTAFFISVYRENCDLKKQAVMAALGIFFMSLAALSRQTFLAALLVLDVLLIIRFLKLNKRFLLAVILFFGQIPVILYLTYLIKNGALHLFLSQMQGHTELFEVGVFRYIKSFVKSRLFLLHLAVFISYTWFTFRNWRSLAEAKSALPIKLNDKFPRIFIFLGILWFLLCLSLSINMLLLNDPINQANPFELFFLMLSILLFALILLPLKPSQKFILAFGLLLCWITSLSSGSNSPAYCLGIVVAINLVLSLYLISFLSSDILLINSITKNISLVSTAMVIAITGVYMQQKINYRDKPSSGLDCKLGKLIPPMGNTLTNPNLYEYYSEFLDIYKSIPAMKNHFVLLPNNAIIYPALKSRNPFPIDWPQHDEYVGQEKLLHEKITKVLQEQGNYILIDKYNVESIADSLEPVNYFHSSVNPQNDLFLKRYLFRLAKYDFMPLIRSNCIEIPANYRFFKLYVSNPKN